jgi:hypothetical protein
VLRGQGSLGGSSYWHGIVTSGPDGRRILPLPSREASGLIVTGLPLQRVLIPAAGGGVGLVTDDTRRGLAILVLVVGIINLIRAIPDRGSSDAS